MGRYATDTKVSVARTRSEIEALVEKYGAGRFASGWDGPRAVVQFEMKELRVRFVLRLPDKEEFRRTPKKGLWRDSDTAAKAWEQACRSQCRSLLLIIKAKLEAVESGITVFEEEFLAHIVMRNGQTVGEYAVPQLPAMLSGGELPPLLPGSN